MLLMLTLLTLFRPLPELVNDAHDVHQLDSNWTKPPATGHLLDKMTSKMDTNWTETGHYVSNWTTGQPLI